MLLPPPPSRAGAASREATDAALALSSLRPGPGGGGGGDAAARGVEGGPRRSPQRLAPRPPAQPTPTHPLAYTPRGAGGEGEDALATMSPSESRDSSESDPNLATDPCTTTNGGEEDGSRGGGGDAAAAQGGAAAAGGADHHPPSLAAVDKTGSRASGGASGGAGVGGAGGVVGGGGGGGRWKPTESQRRLLSATFAQNPYPDVTTKNLLAEQLGVNRPRVSKWFQHRRESATRAGCFQGVEQRARRTPTELLVLNGTHAGRVRSGMGGCGGGTENARRFLRFLVVLVSLLTYHCGPILTGPV